MDRYIISPNLNWKKKKKKKIKIGRKKKSHISASANQYLFSLYPERNRVPKPKQGENGDH